jgi:hypothetical protein
VSKAFHSRRSPKRDEATRLLSVIFIGGSGFGENLNLGARIGADLSIFYLVSYLIFLLEKVMQSGGFLGFFLLCFTHFFHTMVKVNRVDSQ